MNAQKHAYAFGAETGKILQLMIHSLYTNKDIFLRELASNASDACDKCRYGLQKGDFTAEDGDRLRIVIRADEEKNVVEVEDNGVGMTREELIENLGTIAKSGTQQFIDAMKHAKEGGDQLNLIGRFGVGFYSSFMVAHKVEVTTRAAGSDVAHRWTSEGGDGYDVEEAPLDSAPKRGTRVTLHLRDEDAEYASEFRIRHIVRTYSDHVPYPIELKTVKQGLDGKPEETPQEIINEGTALWTEPPKNVEAVQYAEFYRHVAHAGDEPWATLHGKVEGAVAFTYLLFVPTEKPFDLFSQERVARVRLYVKRVFIADEKAELIPPHLRFVRGVIDSEDLPLNISRETLQHNAVLRKIRKTAGNKILAELQKRMDGDRDAYVNFWRRFGAVLKEGLCESIDVEKEKLLDLCLFSTSASPGELISLKDYKARMKDGQKEIYYLIAEDEKTALNSPQLEGFKARGLEVVILTDPVDDFWVNVTHDYDGAPMTNVSRAGLDLSEAEGGDGDKEKESEVDEAEHAQIRALFKETLGGHILEARVSKKLSDSPVCLTVQEGGMDMRLERFLIAQKQLSHAAPKILEVNPGHPIVQAIMKAKDDEKSKEKIWILFDQACISEGEPPQDPHAYGKRIYKLLEEAA